MSLMRHVAVGAVAGATGTAAMDLLLYSRYRRGGGKDSLWTWEFAGGVRNWDDASAPGKLGQKLLRQVTGRTPPEKWARATTNVVHWATGVGWGVQYGAVASRNPSHPWIRSVALGPAAWLSGYVVLPLAAIYKPIWEYDAGTLGRDLSAHLVYGAAASATFAALTRW